MESKEFIRGILKPLILSLFSNRKRMYGYEITQLVKDLSGGRILLTEGALYPTPHKMESEGLLLTETVHIGKRVRKYYTLTQDGKALSKDRVSEFLDFIKTMSAVLQVKVA